MKWLPTLHFCLFETCVPPWLAVLCKHDASALALFGSAVGFGAAIVIERVAVGAKPA